MAIKWEQLFPATAPSARKTAASGLDLNTKKNLLFGGASGASGDYWDSPAETWEFDPLTEDWTQLSPATTPTPASGSSFYTGDIGWDGINGMPMMVVTEKDRTAPFVDELLRFFHWTGTDWSEVFFSFVFPGPSGAASYQAVLSWNPDLGKLLLFVSNTYGTIYEWDGTDWAATGNFPDITGAVGPPFAIAGGGGWSYFPPAQATVYYGGLDTTHVGQPAYDTAFYDGSWTAENYTPPPAYPLARFGFRYSAYLACARCVVIYGNNFLPSPLAPSFTTLILRQIGGVWTWVDVTPAVSPNVAGYGTLMETGYGKVVFFGGWDQATDTYFDETWLLACGRKPQMIRWR